MIVIEKENAVCVDWSEYDLSMDQAAIELFYGRNVIAREFESFGGEDDNFSFPEVEELNASDFSGKSITQIIESIRYYESFGRCPAQESKVVPFPGYYQLNKQEQIAFALLQKVSLHSHWGVAIYLVCRNPDVIKFRRLIVSLKSQAKDSASVMRDILGTSYSSIISL